MKNAMFARILPILLCIVCLLSACTMQKQEEAPVVLNATQQKLADNIWSNRRLWNGSKQLILYRVSTSSGNEYYLSAKFLVSESNQGDLFGTGEDIVVGTYREETFRVVNGQVKDDMTLGENGILAFAKQLGSVYISDTMTDEELRLCINRLASKY